VNANKCSILYLSIDPFVDLEGHVMLASFQMLNGYYKAVRLSLSVLISNIALKLQKFGEERGILVSRVFLPV
jgi:hypothetical protein